MWILHEIDARSIDMVVRGSDVRVFACHEIERALPQIAGEREHVCLVHERHVLALASVRELEGVTNTALDAHACVDTSLRCHLVCGSTAQDAAFTHIRPFGVLANHDEIVWLGVSGRDTFERPLIDIQIELEAHFQKQPSLDHAWRNIRSTDRAEQNRIECAQLRQCVIGKNFAVAQISRTSKVEINRVDVDTGSANHFHCFGCDLRSNTVSADQRNAMCHRDSNLERADSLSRMAKHLLSKATYARLEAEIAHLEHTVLPEVADKIGRARELGDLSENGDYHAAKDEYGMFNDRKNLVKSILENSELAVPPTDGTVGVLSRVTVLFDGDSPDDAETYLIGHIEEKGEGVEVMSPASPIGSALLGHREGDHVSVKLENGATVSVTVTKVAN